MNWLDRHMQALLQQESSCMNQLSLKTSQIQIETVPKEEEQVDESHTAAKHKHDDKKKKKPNNANKGHKKGPRFNFPKVTNKEIMEAERKRKPEFKQIESRFSDTGFKIIR